MKKLLYKELFLSISKFFYILPIILSALMFIPQWIFVIVFMYFFWITAPQIYAQYLAQEDNAFMIMLPVRRKDIAVSRSLALIIIELYHVVLGLICGIAHNLIYGTLNLFIDINPALFGIIFATFGLFNILFLPLYFKTAYFYGKPMVFGVVATTIFALGMEALNLLVPAVNRVIDSGNLAIQLSLLGFGVLVFVVLSFISIKQSVYNYENIK